MAHLYRKALANRRFSWMGILTPLFPFAWLLGGCVALREETIAGPFGAQHGARRRCFPPGSFQSLLMFVGLGCTAFGAHSGAVVYPWLVVLAGPRLFWWRLGVTGVHDLHDLHEVDDLHGLHGKLGAPGLGVWQEGLD